MNAPDHHQQGDVGVTVTRHVIQADFAFHVPYEGGDPVVGAQFPNGFFPSFGSGLAFKGVAADGALELFCLTDRGPNGDGPMVPAHSEQGLSESKIFPAPSFTPSIGILRLDQEGARIASVTPMKLPGGDAVSGLPLPHGAPGSSGEVPLSDSLRFDPGSKAVFHAGGIDSEALAWDARRQCLWITDEYGPFLVSVDPATGTLRSRYGPGQGLPSVLSMRRPNRGMEGMTLDPASDRIHAFLQSPLSDPEDKDVERHARFVRWIEFDPQAGATVAMYAYPLDPADFADGRTGNAKLGDLVALGGGKFVVIEQGEGVNGHIFNRLMLVEIAQASDIAACGPALEKSSISGGAQWAGIKPMSKRVLLDLNAIGWVAEKAEGLTLVDACTLAMSNDNDFGMKSRVYDAGGKEIGGADATALEADAGGNIIGGGTVRVAHAAEKERPLTLWLLRFDRPLAA